MVAEPSVEDTIAILRGLKESYEVHHGVRIKDAAIVAAATLSHRYITDRHLPDKAVDLIDEAASKLRMEIDSRPAEIDEVERKITQEEIEREALQKRAGPGLQGAPGQDRKGAGRPARKRARCSRPAGRRKRRSSAASRPSRSRSRRPRSTRPRPSGRGDLARAAEI